MAKTDAVQDAEPDAAAPPAVELDRSPSHLLHRALQQALEIYGEELGEGAPTQRQFALLSAAAAPGRTQTDLVNATGIDRSTLADMVARMMAKGVLERERSASDARANVVRLTDAGRAVLDEATPKVAAADVRILSRLSPKAREAFLTVLAAFSAPIGAPEATGPAKAPKPKGHKPEKLAKAERGDKKRKKKSKKS